MFDLVSCVANALIFLYKKVGFRCKRAAAGQGRPSFLVLAFGEYLLTIETNFSVCDAGTNQLYSFVY